MSITLIIYYLSNLFSIAIKAQVKNSTYLQLNLKMIDLDSKRFLSPIRNIHDIFCVQK